ncbi:MAG: hypothetical protein RLZZ595_2068, partial [Bacteroidota bacterium]
VNWMEMPGKPTWLFLLTTTPPMALVAWDMLSKEKKKEKTTTSNAAKFLFMILDLFDRPIKQISCQKVEWPTDSCSFSVF